MKRCVEDWGGADDHSVHDALLLRDLLRYFLASINGWRASINGVFTIINGRNQSANGVLILVHGLLTSINRMLTSNKWTADWGGADDKGVHDALLLRDLVHLHPLTQVLWLIDALLA